MQAIPFADLLDPQSLTLPSPRLSPGRASPQSGALDTSTPAKNPLFGRSLHIKRSITAHDVSITAHDVSITEHDESITSYEVVNHST
jgi:hypothetical protein